MPFDGQPTLSGALVGLRPLRPEDYDDLYAVGSDPLIWEQHPDRNRWQVERFRTFFDESLSSGGALLIIDTATQRVIGSSRFFEYREDRSEVEIGWTLRRPTRHGIFGTAARECSSSRAMPLWPRSPGARATTSAAG